MKNQTVKYHLRMSDKHLTAATKLAVKEIIRRARIVLKNNKKAKEFIMAMGTYFFSDHTGKVLYSHEYEPKYLCGYIDGLPEELKITGVPIRLKSTGKVITDW